MKGVKKMIFSFKRVGLLLSLMFVELFLIILFFLFYAKILWANWDTSMALYVLVVLIPIFMLTSYLFIKNKNDIKRVIASTNFVKAKITNKKQIGRLNRKIIIWSYEYQINDKIINKNYWNFVEVRKLNIGDSFSLAVVENIPYFPITEQ